jgi:hypothetical protein
VKTVVFILTLNGNVPQDKSLHLLAGSGISTVARSSGCNYWQSAAIGTGVGLLKEGVYDKMLGKGNPSVKDAIATAVGSLINFKITIGKNKSKHEKKFNTQEEYCVR